MLVMEMNSNNDEKSNTCSNALLQRRHHVLLFMHADVSRVTRPEGARCPALPGYGTTYIVLYRDDRCIPYR